MKGRFILFLSFFMSTLLFPQPVISEDTTKTKSKDVSANFLATELILSGYYAMLLPSALNIEDKPESFIIGVGGEILTLGTLWNLTRNHPPTSKGTPGFVLSGGINGLIHGAFLTPSNGMSKAVLPLMFSIGENILNYNLSEHYKLKEDDAIRFSNYTLLGYTHAFLLQTMLKKKFNNWHWRSIYPLLSTAEGYGLTMATYKNDTSSGNAVAEFEFIRVGITTSFLLTHGIDFMLNDTVPPSIYACSAFIGSIGGAYLGHRLSTEYEVNNMAALILAPTLIEGIVLGGFMPFIFPSKSVEGNNKLSGSANILLGVSDALGIYLFYKMLSKPKKKRK